MLEKHGLPPRERNADVPQSTDGAFSWLAGVIVLCTVLGLVLFGTTRMNDSTASNPNLNGESGMTTGTARK
jgi:hypothetical protein